MKKHSILFILPSASLGGSELCTLESIAVLKKEGHHIHCIVPFSGSFIKELKILDVKYDIISYDWWVSNKKWPIILKTKMLSGFIKSSYKIKRTIKKENIEKVITVSSVTPVGAIAAKLSNVMHYWFIHEFVDDDHNLVFNYGKKLTYQIISLSSKKILTVSQTLKEHLTKYIKNKTIQVIPNITEYPIKEPLQKVNNPFKVTMIGRISKSKNQLIAVKAIRLLVNQNIKITLSIIGAADKDYLNTIQNYIQEHNLENNISISPFTPNPEDYVHNSDCVLVCSIKEAFGRVTIEAMKSGKLVIASNTGAGKELIKDGVTGYLFDPFNEIDLANCIVKAFEKEKKYQIETNALIFAKSHFNAVSHLEQFKMAIS